MMLELCLNEKKKKEEEEDEEESPELGSPSCPASTCGT